MQTINLAMVPIDTDDPHLWDTGAAQPEG